MAVSRSRLESAKTRHTDEERLAMPRVIESDVCVLGGGITAAMVSEKLSELRGNLKIAVVEAGNKVFNFNERSERRRRFLEYGENPHPNDHIRGQSARGIQ